MISSFLDSKALPYFPVLSIEIGYVFVVLMYFKIVLFQGSSECYYRYLHDVITVNWKIKDTAWSSV